MRPLPLVLVLILLAPGALASVCFAGGECRGNGAGVEVLGVSTGTWDIIRVNVTTAGTLSATLTWTSSPNGADYDMTLWKPGADLDGVLSQDEILKIAWTPSNTPGESLQHPVAPHPLRYVLTIEPVTAKLETYTAQVSGGKAIGTCHGVVYLATAGRVCAPAATASTKIRD